MSDLRTSIALCTYNGGPYLAEQLKSYTRQSKLPDELVVCDDKSGDTTVEILRSFAEVAPFPIKWHINDCNLGTVKNFERAIHLCSGDIIFLSDQDDVWRDDKISSVMDVFGKHPEVGAVFSDAEVVDQALCSLGYRMWHTVGFTLSRQRQMNVKGGSFSVLLKYNVVTGATMAFRSEFTPRFSPLPEGWVHDGWIALMIAAISDIGLVPEPLFSIASMQRTKSVAFALMLSNGQAEQSLKRGSWPPRNYRIGSRNTAVPETGYEMRLINRDGWK